VKNEFFIQSIKDIQKLADAGLYKVIVDFSKSKNNEKEIYEQITPEASKEFEPGELIPLPLREAIQDKNLTSEQKASVIRTCSIEIMKRLLEAPTPENVHKAKEDLYEVVDCILAEDEIAAYLTQITDHDLYTYTHSVNVGILFLLLARKYFSYSSSNDLRELGAGLFLHDLGKTRVNPAILNKQGRLTDTEMLEVRTHPKHSFDILREANRVTAERKIITLQHHEREDGSGYPDGLRGEEVHIYAQICSLADFYDALTCDRPYRQRLSPFQALKLIKREISGHVQQNLFENMIFLLGKN
jgi:HD-GYP domain-containing protein (c-di-GMP phosphodiesterase class II)